MPLPRCIAILIACGPLLMGMQAGPAAQPKPPAKEAGQQAPASPKPEEHSHPPLAPAPSPPPVPGEPLYSLEAHRQDVDSLIWAFAERAHMAVTILDRAPTLVDVSFTGLPRERAFKSILLAADLDYVKNEDGYVVGLPIDLKQRFPDPNDKFIEATYRCRRIDASSLARTLGIIFEGGDFRVGYGPKFLTPEVAEVETFGDDSTGARNAKTLNARRDDATFRTHDVVFSGPPEVVRQALSIARKLDHPRKQVRVNVRIMQMTTSAAKNLGVAWMQSLNLAATELGDARIPQAALGNTSVVQGSGLTLGKFTHSVVSLNATLNAMEQSGNSKTLANPTLMVLDGERSYILSGTKYTLPQIKLDDPAGQMQYDTTSVMLGLYLQVGVQVGLDDDMVLTIFPQVSSLNGFTTINTIDYPIVNTVEEQATVRALKGDVIVLGGLKRDLSSDNKAGVPLLGSLPLLGKLFSNDSWTDNTEELMFFLTPEIVEDQEQPLDITLSVTPGPAKAVS